jgi:hypothetical protein
VQDIERWAKSNQGGIETRKRDEFGQHTVRRKAKSNQGGIETTSGAGVSGSNVRCGQNRTKVGLKLVSCCTTTVAQTLDVAKSNQGGIETESACTSSLSGTLAARQNRTKVGLKHASRI